MDTACRSHQAALALGIAAMLSTEIFAPDLPPALGRWMLARMPARVELWTRIYGRRAILADTPGTKLGLLLKDVVHGTDPGWEQKRRTALIPRRRAPRLLHVSRNDGLRKLLHAELYQIRYDLFRLRFHLVEGARYLYESFRFERTLAQPNITAAAEHTFADLQKGRL